MTEAALQIQTPRIFVPLLSPSRYKGAFGGRGSGKSHFYAESIVEFCMEVAGARVVCVREVQRSLKESVKRLVTDKIMSFEQGHAFRDLTDSIITPGNGVILFQGMQDHTAESIKSLEAFDIAYVEEAQTLTARSLEMLRPTIRGSPRMKRLGRKSELWFSWNPRNASDPVDALLRGEHPPTDSTVVRTSYKDNPWFPEELEEERLYDEQHNPLRYPHIWEGEYEPTAIGAIWNREVIHRNRRNEAPELGRILIGIDPPVSSEEGANECGIIAGGIGSDQRGYVLGDYSLAGTPEAWGSRAVSAYDIHSADAIIAEVNQGGDMVEHVIKSIRPDIRVIKVRATRGKHVRAEPISALYSMDRISHVGTYPVLENQMCLTTAEGYEGEDSPDRMDAMVWVFTELFPKITKRVRERRTGLPTRANNQYSPRKGIGR